MVSGHQPPGPAPWEAHVVCRHRTGDLAIYVNGRFQHGVETLASALAWLCSYAVETRTPGIVYDKTSRLVVYRSVSLDGHACLTSAPIGPEMFPPPFDPSEERQIRTSTWVEDTLLTPKPVKSKRFGLRR